LLAAISDSGSLLSQPQGISGGPESEQREQLLCQEISDWTVANYYGCCSLSL